MPVSALKLTDAEAPRIELGDGKAFRQPLAGGGRAHVDRALPFLILNRFNGDPHSLATHVATTSPAYVAWEAEDDGEAHDLICALAARLRDTHPRVLLVSLYDLPRDPALDDTDPELERFTSRLSTGDGDAAQAASTCLEAALKTLTVDLRTCKVEHVSKAWFEPGIEALIERTPWLDHLSLGLPQNYRVPGEDAIYPQLLHELASGVFDALLKGFNAYFAEVSPPAPRSHRALGRSAFVAAARTIDRKLYRISQSFDFLLSVSPINTAQAFERFEASKYEEAPAFRYRPLTVDPDLAKRALYAIDLRRAEDPVLETLFAEKRHELDQQLTMIQVRNTPAFRYSSIVLYGPVERDLLAQAGAILDGVPKRRGEGGDCVGCAEVRDAAHALVARYRKADPGFNARVTPRADIASGMMVSGHTLMIATDTRTPKRRLEALLHHEVSVHILTCVNGAAQGLKIFEAGLAGYEGVQEGLGVFAECAVGGMTAARLRLLAARVLVVDAMIEGAGFVECFRLLRREHRYSAEGAFNIVARVFRSGGFAKDAIYLRGFGEVLALLARGQSLDPFWTGKIAARHLPVVEELELRGMLRAPRSTPEFLSDPQARVRIEAMRALTSPADLVREDLPC